VRTTIIDTTFFFEELSIAQLTEVSVQSTVTRFIQKLEPEYLRDLLGAALYKAFEEGRAEVTPVAKWADLLNGKDYTNRRGEEATWRGLREVVTEPVAGPPAVAGVYRSPVANYVYWHYMRHHATITTGSGEKKLKAINAEVASPAEKIARAWNAMVEWNGELVEFLLSNPADYPGFTMRYSDNRFYRLIHPVNTFGV
jgi:hypothetical protein